jgi:S1-C subfamily serine protease
VIVAIDGKPVRNLFELSNALDERAAGEVVEVKALRGVDGNSAQEVLVKATLGIEQQ